LAACSALGDNATLFGYPSKYQYSDCEQLAYSDCEQLAAQRKIWSTREQELKLLMDRAAQGAGCTLVNVLAYKGDYVAASEELSGAGGSRSVVMILP
jgi:hypothetical protein